VRLHIGCGDINVPGFINLDARPKPHVHIVTTNLFRLKMIPHNVADMIYMSHVLEHVSHRDIVATLREMHRILKDGGVLRISVPDFDRIIDIYQATERDITAIEQPLMGGQDYPFNYHYAAFNDAHLRKTMLESGFRETRTWDPQNCDHHEFDDWASRNISWGDREFAISLNIEAIK
jgi:predicted SAM-dependent methyltransferase